MCHTGLNEDLFKSAADQDYGSQSGLQEVVPRRQRGTGEAGDPTLYIRWAHLERRQLWLSDPKSVQMLRGDTSDDCGEDELRSVLLRLHIDSFHVGQPRSEGP